MDGQRRVYYLALLRHIGCTADNPELAGLLGDELAFRAGMGTRDVSSGRALLPYLLQLTVGARPAAERPAALLHLLTHARRHEAGRAPPSARWRRCSSTGSGSTTPCASGCVEDLVMVYERYDGHGFPNRLGAEDISPPAQIVQLAEAVTVHLAARGTGRRAGDAAGAARAAPSGPTSWTASSDDAAALTAELDDPWAEVLAMEPGGAPVLGGERVDDVLVAIADFADLKSPYTAGHSRSVASLAGGRRRVCGLPAADGIALRRAGWIHDVGRISVSVAVWDKPGPLVRDETGAGPPAPLRHRADLRPLAVPGPGGRVGRRAPRAGRRQRLPPGAARCRS